MVWKRPHYPQCTGEEWERARMRCLVRDDFRCQAGRLGLGECDEHRLRFLIVHHIVPRIRGGTHELSNLITVCYAHHAEIHPHLRKELAERETHVLAAPLKEL